MNVQTIISIVTFITSLILGEVSKYYNIIDKKKIPIQNLIIGVVVAVIEFIITKNFETAIALSGVTAGGAYDIIHNLKKLKGEN